MLLVTAPGVDALEEVMKLAARRSDLNLTVVSLGQGQEEAAESAINSAVHNGGWVILQNLHHARNWLPDLATMVNEIGESYKSSKTSYGVEPHPEFRLILTTQPTEDVTNNVDILGLCFYNSLTIFSFQLLCFDKSKKLQFHLRLMRKLV